MIRKFIVSVGLVAATSLLSYSQLKTFKTGNFDQKPLGVEGYPDCAGILKNGTRFFTNQQNGDVKINIHNPGKNTKVVNSIKATKAGNFGFIVKVITTGDRIIALDKISNAGRQTLYAMEIDQETGNIKNDNILVGSIANAPEAKLSSGGFAGKPYKSFKDIIRGNFVISQSNNLAYTAILFPKNYNASGNDIHTLKLFDKNFNTVFETDIDPGFGKNELEFGAIEVDNSGNCHVLFEKTLEDKSNMEKLLYFNVKADGSLSKSQIGFSTNAPARSNVFYQKEDVAFRRLKVANELGSPAYVLKLDPNGNPVVAGLYSNMQGEYIQPVGYFIAKPTTASKNAMPKFVGFNGGISSFVTKQKGYWNVTDLKFFDNGDMLISFTQAGDDAAVGMNFGNREDFGSYLLAMTINGVDLKMKNYNMLPYNTSQLPNPYIGMAGDKAYLFLNDCSQNNMITDMNGSPKVCEPNNKVMQYISIDQTGKLTRNILPDWQNSVVKMMYGNLQNYTCHFLIKDINSDTYSFGTVALK
jgi:hypothetical protein